MVTEIREILHEGFCHNAEDSRLPVVETVLLHQRVRRHDIRAAGPHRGDDELQWRLEFGAGRPRRPKLRRVNHNPEDFANIAIARLELRGHAGD